MRVSDNRSTEAAYQTVLCLRGLEYRVAVALSFFFKSVAYFREIHKLAQRCESCIPACKPEDKLRQDFSPYALLWTVITALAPLQRLSSLHMPPGPEFARNVMRFCQFRPAASTLATWPLHSADLNRRCRSVASLAFLDLWKRKSAPPWRQLPSRGLGMVYTPVSNFAASDRSRTQTISVGLCLPAKTFALIYRLCMPQPSEHAAQQPRAAP